VEVVVPLAERQQRRDPAIPRGVAVGVRRGARVVRQRVHKEGGVVHHDEASDARDEVAAPVVAPQQAAGEGGHDDAHEGRQQQVVLVLQAADGVRVQVCGRARRRAGEERKGEH